MVEIFNYRSQLMEDFNELLDLIKEKVDIKHKHIDEIVDFIFEHTNYTPDRKLWTEIVSKHLQYNTCMIIHQDNKVIAFYRWNIIQDGTVAELLDLMIEKTYRNNGIINMMIKEFIKGHPTVKWLIWKRGIKYPDRQPVCYEINRFLKFKEG